VNQHNQNDRGAVRDGVRDIFPVAVAAVAIGMVFGALASSKGLSPLESGLMSILVFAGGSQFAAVELWARPVPIFTIALSTLLINLRHVLMGASLAPKLGRFSFVQRLLALHFLTDESWALAERRALSAPITPSYWFAVATLLPMGWITGTIIGATLGPVLGDPKTFGADFAFTAVFIGLIAGLWKGRSTAIAVIASGIASALVYVTLGAPWHVAIGAAAGIISVYLTAKPERQPA
jgi:4-azaleucine resistance transporter AzlC